MTVAEKCRIEESVIPRSYLFTVADGGAAGYAHKLYAFKTWQQLTQNQK